MKRLLRFLVAAAAAAAIATAPGASGRPVLEPGETRPVVAVEPAAPGPWAGPGVFESADWTSDIPHLAGLRWVALIPELTTPAQVAQLHVADPQVVVTLWSPFWASKAPPYILERLRELHAAGWIGEVETPLNDAPAQVLALGQVLAQAGIPHAMTGPNFSLVWGPDAQVPAGWVLMPYAYANNDPRLTPAFVIADTRWHSATAAIVPLLGGFSPDSPLGQASPSAARDAADAVYEAQLPQPGAAGEGIFVGPAMNAREWALMHELSDV